MDCAERKAAVGFGWQAAIEQARVWEWDGLSDGDGMQKEREEKGVC